MKIVAEELIMISVNYSINEQEGIKFVIFVEMTAGKVN